MKTDFEAYLHPEFIQLIEKLHLQGFKIGIVGGTVRDFFLAKKASYDYDCELRSVAPVAHFEDFFLSLSLPIEYKVEYLPYHVIRVKHSEFECELSMPRKESYKSEFSHSNFSAQFFNDVDYTEAFYRRDFTINAMMFEFNGHWSFHDPLEGKKDLEKKLLRACSDSFYRDPVRFLRAIRFQMKLGFSLSEEILAYFKKLSLDDFSSHYLRQEAMKSQRPVCFVYNLFEQLEENIDKKFKTFLFENEIFETDLKTHLSSLLFLSAKTQQKIFDLFDFSMKPKKVFFPLSFYKLAKMQLDDFIQYDLEFSCVQTIKQLEKIPPLYFNYLYQLDMLDITYEEFRQMMQQKIELDEVEPQYRSSYQVYKKIEFYFGS
jgi:hypothetical protein